MRRTTSTSQFMLSKNNVTYCPMKSCSGSSKEQSTQWLNSHSHKPMIVHFAVTKQRSLVTTSTARLFQVNTPCLMTSLSRKSPSGSTQNTEFKNLTRRVKKDMEMETKSQIWSRLMVNTLTLRSRVIFMAWRSWNRTSTDKLASQALWLF